MEELMHLWKAAFTFSSSRRYLWKPQLRFISLHYIWVLGWAIVGSVLIYPAGMTAYIDALFLASGASTQTSLHTVDINLLHTYQQIVIYIIGMITNPIFVHSSVVYVRLYWFEKRFKYLAYELELDRAVDFDWEDDICEEGEGPSSGLAYGETFVKRIKPQFDSGRSLNAPTGGSGGDKVFNPEGLASSASSSVRPEDVVKPPEEFEANTDPATSRSAQMSSASENWPAITDGAHFFGSIRWADDVESRHEEPRAIQRFLPRKKEERVDGGNIYLSWQPTTGSGSFAQAKLTDMQREELGGIEYRSLKTLALILGVYYVGFHLLGVVVLIPWILRTNTWGEVVDASGQNRTWWAIFSSASFFNNTGYALTPDSFNSFRQSTLVLLLGSFLMVMGRMGFPCMLRFVVWSWSTCVPKYSSSWEEVKFLLDHPRRCFTLLFPGAVTWQLLALTIICHGLGLILFVVLDSGDDTVTSLPSWYRFLDGLYQSVSAWTSGTSCVDLADLRPGMQVTYLILMYISALPIVLSIKRRNASIYENKSLGIYSTRDGSEEPGQASGYLRTLLLFDVWLIFLGWFIIAIAEGKRIADPEESSFTLFACLFEIISSYGTIGLSLGYRGIDASLSAEFGVVSKLVIIAMQLRGRHKDVPYDLDRSILLPSEANAWKDKQAAKRPQVGGTRDGTDVLQDECEEDEIEADI